MTRWTHRRLSLAPPPCIRHCIGCYKCALFSSVQYDGPSVKEKINSSLFSLPFIGERKKKINLNLFSLPFIRERKWILFYFHSCLLRRENRFKFTFTPVYWWEKINLNSFFPDLHRKVRKYISSNDWLPGSFSDWYGLLSLYQIAKWNWEPRKVKQVLTFWQFIRYKVIIAWTIFWCKYIVASQQDIGFFLFEKCSYYVHPQ